MSYGAEQPNSAHQIEHQPQAFFSNQVLRVGLLQGSRHLSSSFPLALLLTDDRAAMMKGMSPMAMRLMGMQAMGDGREAKKWCSVCRMG